MNLSHQISYKKILFKTLILVGFLEFLIYGSFFLGVMFFLSIFFILYFTRTSIPWQKSIHQGDNNSSIVKSWILNNKKDISFFWKNKQYVFFVTPIFLYLGVLSFILFQGRMIVAQLLIFVFAFFYLLFLKSLNEYFQPGEIGGGEKDESSSRKYFLENIFTALNIFSLFLIYSVLFSLYPLFGISFVWSLLLVVLTTFLSNWQLFFVYGFSRRNSLLFNFLIIFIISEFFWSFSLLPVSFFSTGLALISIYYFLLGIIYFYQKKQLDKSKIIRHFLIAFLATLFSLFTTNWS